MKVDPRIVRVSSPPEPLPPTGDRLEGVGRLAVVRADKLGDLVVSLPAVAALRGAYSDTRLALFVDPGWERLARMVDGVDEVHAADGNSLAAFGADAVVCISREGSTAWAAQRAGIRERIGTGRRAWSWLFTRRVGGSRRASRLHEAHHALEFARRAGATVPAGPPVYGLTLDANTVVRAAAWLASRDVDEGFVLVHPGSGGSCPRWPAAHYGEIVRRLTGEGRRVVVSLGPDDAALARAFVDPPAGARTFDGGLTELIGLAACACAALGNSSGPLHLAAALGVPTLTLHAPWRSCDALRWGPYAVNGVGLVAHSAEAVDWTHAERRRGGEALMAALSPDDVMRTLSTLLSAD